MESVRGKGGGVRLAQDPQDIHLGQIVRTSEGSAAVVECFSPESNTCRIAPACRLTNILVEAFDALYQTLDSYTLVANRKVLRRVLASHP